MPSLYLFNTEARKIEEIIPREGRHVRLYTCGPTVYHFAHIGNFRAYVAEDLLKRTLQFLEYQVTHVMNITDVDDKTIQGAKRENSSLLEYTTPYTEAFFQDLKSLKIEPADSYPRATDYIPDMIRMIEELIAKEFAYRSHDGSVYFSIRKFSKYGRLSHLLLDELKKNASGDNSADEYDKDNASDFVLWKVYDVERDGAIYWESPWGRGRPGWHIECSAMAMQLLGKTVDIHCGGVDNMFPHHENEIAQSECCSGHLFVRYWMHVEHLLVEHRKMSKSLGNFYTLRDLLEKGYDPRAIRYLLLATHYRMPLNFSFAGLDAAKSTLERLSALIRRLEEVQGHEIPVVASLERANRDFAQALAQDLNISEALAVLFDLVRDLNSMCDAKELGPQGASQALQMLRQWDQVLGIMPFEALAIPESVTALLEAREVARKARDFQRSDDLRRELNSLGYTVEDTPSGARLRKNY